MYMNITTHRTGNMAVLSLSGNLWSGAIVENFMERLQILVDNGCKKVVIDMGAVNLINTEGIRMLIKGCTILKKVAGGDLRFANLNERAAMILVDICQLDNVFEIYDTVGQAKDMTRISGTGVRPTSGYSASHK